MTIAIRVLLLVAVSTAFAAVPRRDGFFDSNGVRIHYVEAGQGEPVVLVHGRGDTVQNWLDNGVLNVLAANYHVIAFDCRGHGQSDKPHDPRQYGAEMGLDIARLLDHLVIRRAHVVAYSMGAMITSQLLVTHPERFFTVTLGGATARFDWTDKEEQLFREGAEETERWGFSPKTRQAIAPPGAPKLTEAEIEKESAKLLADPNQDRFAIAALMRSFREQVISPAEAAACKIPTLGIVGGDDPQLEQFKRLKALRPGLKLVVIDGATHTGERDVRKRPEFVAAIRSFLADHPGKP